jgi:hypothetical protein
MHLLRAQQAEQMMNDPEFKDEIQRYMASLRTVSASIATKQCTTAVYFCSSSGYMCLEFHMLITIKLVSEVKRKALLLEV